MSGAEQAWATAVACDDEPRRERLRQSDTRHGIDFVEVMTEPPADAHRTLVVYLGRKSSPTGQQNQRAVVKLVADAFLDRGGNVRVEPAPLPGGRVEAGRLSVLVQSVTASDDRLIVSMDRPGDLGPYTLVLDHDDLDTILRACVFVFRPECTSRADCKPEACEPRPALPGPVIDYLARDYRSLRQGMLDRLSSISTGWGEPREADLGITLVELLAYVGDRLSYAQDAVATEAYLETARRRVSVRRHARLVDYAVDDGESACTLLFVEVKPGVAAVTLPALTPVLSRVQTGASAPPEPPPVVVPEPQARKAIEAAELVFETQELAVLRPELNRISLHAWGNERCCLPPGATSADLVGQLDQLLVPGSFLLLEPCTAAGEPATRGRAVAVRVKGATRLRDDLLQVDVTRVSWDEDDALAEALPLRDEGTSLVARGNLVRVTHGREVTEASTVPERRTARPFELTLDQGPLSFRRTPSAETKLPSVRELQRRSGRQGSPDVSVRVQAGTAPAEPWEPRATLLSKGATEKVFVVETEDDGRARLRFGDGVDGMRAPAGARVEVTYRVGAGARGNAGANSLVRLVERTSGTAGTWSAGVEAVRNPLAAWGGRDPEPTERIRQLAPAAFHGGPLYRAVTEDDYARVAEGHPRVARAVATFRWTGSWTTVFLALDPAGQTGVDEALRAEVRARVSRYAQAGYDLEIGEPVYVPLEVEIAACVRPDRFRVEVERAVRAALGSAVSPAGKRGFFHPDNLTFGQPVVLSALYAAVLAVDGVDSVRVTALRRRGRGGDEALTSGSLTMGRLEIARLDDDRNRANQGILKLTMAGGK